MKIVKNCQTARGSVARNVLTKVISPFVYEFNFVILLLFKFFNKPSLSTTTKTTTTTTIISVTRSCCKA